MNIISNIYLILKNKINFKCFVYIEKLLTFNAAKQKVPSTNI